jgi:hypothetical protein
VPQCGILPYAGVDICLFELLKDRLLERCVFVVAARVTRARDVSLCNVRWQQAAQRGARWLMSLCCSRCLPSACVQV